MKILLIGSPIFKKLRQKLEYHLPQSGHTTVSTEYLDGLIIAKQSEMAKEEMRSTEACVIVTNETGFIDEASASYIEAAIELSLPIVSLGVLNVKNYSDIPVQPIADMIAGEIAFASVKKATKKKTKRKEFKEEDKEGTKQIEEQAAAIAEKVFEEKIDIKSTIVEEPKDEGIDPLIGSDRE